MNVMHVFRNHFAKNQARYLLGSVSLFFTTLFSILMGTNTPHQSLIFLGTGVTFPITVYLLINGRKKHILLMDSGLALFAVMIHTTFAMAAGVSLQHHHWMITILLMIYGASALVTILAMMKVLEMN